MLISRLAYKNTSSLQLYDGLPPLFRGQDVEYEPQPFQFKSSQEPLFYVNPHYSSLHFLSSLYSCSLIKCPKKQNIQLYLKHICFFPVKILVQGICYLTTHSLSWLWRAVFLAEAAGLQLGWSGADCSLRWRSRSHLYGALWAQAHLREARSDVHAFSSYSTAHGNPDGEED